MGRHKQRVSSSSLLAATALATFAVLFLMDLYVWNQGQNAQAPLWQAAQSQVRKQQEPKEGKTHSTADSYNDWLTYSNAAYGVSFKYPSDWMVKGAASSPSMSSCAIEAEYTIALGQSAVKYNQTASLEVIDQPLEKVAMLCDSQFEQTLANKVTKTADLLKGTKSLQYVAADMVMETKLYLFDVNGKTYLFSSINGESNLHYDTDYWSKLNKIFDSLQITP